MAEITLIRDTKTLKGLLDSMKSRIAEVVPKHITPERMMKMALVATSRSPKLLECTQTSFLESVMRASECGVDCSGTLGSGYLVPFRNNKLGVMECQFIIGYRGLIDLARRGGQIATIEAHCVYANDKFVVRFGTDPKIEHDPSFDGNPGALKCVYAVAVLRDGTKQSEVMTRAQIDGIRARSKAKDSGPWVTDYDEMARKTVVRRICKYLPLSPEMERAIELDNEPIDVEVVSARDTTPGETRTERLKNRLTAPPPADDTFDADAGREIPISADANGNTVAEPAAEAEAPSPTSDDDKPINKALLDRMKKAAMAMDPNSRNAIYYALGHGKLAEEGFIGGYAKTLTTKQGRELAAALERGEVPQTV